MNRATVAGVSVGDGLDVAVVGALNVSPESFYSGSVVNDADRLLRAAQAMAEAGAAWLDVGAMSTAPYLEARIPETQEADRLRWAVGLLTAKLDIPVCADTSRVLPARAALESGARLLNDVSGLAADAGLARLAADAGAGLVLMAAPAAAPAPGAPIETVRASLAGSLARARAAGVPDERILLDPGIGFFRDPGIAWPEWDCRVLAGLPALRSLGRPLYVGVSRKSFIGALAGAPDPADRLPGTLAATAAAVLGGAHVIRAHDVAETAQAVRIAQAIRRTGAEGA
ncbi:MAG TPA: dihydropteroate synthase [Methylomirabilota bacterium]|nr:dihydropteroate synthase [Methylomirabilota bacterium]